MTELKSSLRLELIKNSDAKRLLTRRHPLGPGAGFSFALGIFWNGRCEGVMTFGNPITNVAVMRYKLAQHEALELRKMWISDVPTRNSESRVLAIAARLIKKQYPKLQLLLTYCDDSEGATAYRAAGWIPQAANRYIREVKVSGRWLSIRNANRLKITEQATEKKYECRRKFVLPLNASVDQLVRSLPVQGRDGGSSPTQTLSIEPVQPSAAQSQPPIAESSSTAKPPSTEPAS